MVEWLIEWTHNHVSFFVEVSCASVERAIGRAMHALQGGLGSGRQSTMNKSNANRFIRYNIHRIAIGVWASRIWQKTPAISTQNASQWCLMDGSDPLSMTKTGTRPCSSWSPEPRTQRRPTLGLCVALATSRGLSGVHLGSPWGFSRTLYNVVNAVTFSMDVLCLNADGNFSNKSVPILNLLVQFLITLEILEANLVRLHRDFRKQRGCEQIGSLAFVLGTQTHRQIWLPPTLRHRWKLRSTSASTTRSGKSTSRLLRKTGPRFLWSAIPKTSRPMCALWSVNVQAWRHKQIYVQKWRDAKLRNAKLRLARAKKCNG